MRSSSILLLALIYLGFISLGLPDGTLGVAWPSVHVDVRMPIEAAGVLVVFGTLLSAISGFSSGRVIARFGTPAVVSVSCLLTGGALLLISHAQSLGWLVAAMLPLGLGAGAVDAGLNGYVARHYSGRHMNWLHACWGVGATVGPLILAASIGTALGWRGGYLGLGLAQVSLAALFFATHGLWAQVPERVEDTSGGASAEVPTTGARSVAGWLSAAIFAIYVAVEGTTGVWAASILVEARDVSPSLAGICAAGFYGSITVGRIAVGFVVDRWGARRLVSFGCVVAAIGGVVFALASGPALAACGLVLLGLGFSPVYPCLMHEVPRRFAPDAVQIVIGRQSGASYVGAASLPAIAGWVSSGSLEVIPWIVVAGIGVLAAAVRWLDRLTPQRVA